jgi:hypothetical protein
MTEPLYVDFFLFVNGNNIKTFCSDLVYKASDKVMQVLKQKTIPYEVLDEIEEPMEVSHVDA